MLSLWTFITAASLLHVPFVGAQATATVIASGPFTDEPTSIVNPPSIVGYDSVATESTIRTWYGEPWTTHGSIAGPCPTGEPCNLVSGCSGGNLVYENGTTAGCGSPLETGCKTLNIYDSPPASGILIQRHACFMGWPSTVYRRSFFARATPITAAILTVGTSSRPYPAMFSGGPSWHRKSSSLSKGSIAGIVVGAIAGLVLIIGGLVFFLRKRKARQNNQNLVNIEENAQAPQMTHIVAAQHNHVVAEVDDGHAEKKVEVLPPYTGPRAGEYAVEAPTKEKKSFKN